MSGVNFRVQKGDKVGLVGRNGAGKTTLTKILAGDGQPTLGSVSVHGQIGYLPQDPRSGDPKELVRTRILNARGLGDIAQRMAKATIDMASSDPKIHDAAMKKYARDLTQAARDDMFQLGRHQTTKGSQIAPVRSSSALVLSSTNTNRERIYVQQPPISAITTISPAPMLMGGLLPRLAWRADEPGAASELDVFEHDRRAAHPALPRHGVALGERQFSREHVTVERRERGLCRHAAQRAAGGEHAAAR